MYHTLRSSVYEGPRAEKDRATWFNSKDRSYSVCEVEAALIAQRVDGNELPLNFYVLLMKRISVFTLYSHSDKYRSLKLSNVQF